MWCCTYLFQGANCCSQLSISFHYTNPVQMYLLEFMLYQSEIYGRSHATDHEPMFSQNISLIQNKKENEILLTPKYFWHYLFGNKEVYSNCNKNTATIYVTMLCIFIYQILLYTNSNCWYSLCIHCLIYEIIVGVNFECNIHVPKVYIEFTCCWKRICKLPMLFWGKTSSIFREN